MTRQLSVYNLEFEWPGEAMAIASYVFEPSPGYTERFQRLQHLVDVHGGSRPVRACTGSHQATGTVRVPDSERSAALAWQREDVTELSDVVLLLSLFTGRKVFVLDPGYQGPVIADPRCFQWGGSLGLSLGQVSRGVDEGEERAIRLSDGVSRVNDLIRSETWQVEYCGGHFLFLFLSACHRQIIDSSFVLCWTIWEHLFRLRSRRWLSERALRHLDVREKVAFVVTEYRLREAVDKEDLAAIDRFARIRHRLVHDGTFDKVEDVLIADLFIRLTECIIVRILGLEPTQVFSADERYARLRDGQLL